MTFKTTSKETQKKNKHEKHSNHPNPPTETQKSTQPQIDSSQTHVNNTKKKPEKQMDSRGAEHKHEEIERSFLPVSKLKEERGSMIEETGSQQREIEKASIGG